MKNVKKAILLMTIIFAPMLFTACEEENILDTETSVTDDSYDVEDVEDEL